jgi:fatty acid desaturase
VTPTVPRLAQADVARLHRRSDLRPALDVAFIALRLVAALWLFEHFRTWWAYAIAFVVVAALQHHLSIVHHEAVHSLLFTSRFWNEALFRVAGWLIGFGVSYREHHFTHHRRLGDPDGDPDLHNYERHPLPPRAFVADLAASALGVATLVQFVKQSLRGARRAPSTGVRDLAGILAMQVLVASALWASGRWYDWLIIWALPLGTLAKLLAHARNVAEHTQLRDLGDRELSRLRTFRSNPVEKFFLAPLGFNFHAEHHIYPAVQYFRLRELHRLLAADARYAEAIDLQPSYIRFLVERAISDS